LLVANLKPAMVGVNMIVKVVSLNVVVEKAHNSGSKTCVAEALVGDHTGSIILTAKGGRTFISEK
jgi:ssDNA-binding replication factor A large subunit